MPWTGERMVPFASDMATQMFHYQRYLYFRPWYQGKVVDAASGEGYGTGFASCFADSAVGIEIASDAVQHATERYDAATFVQSDVCTFDYSDADLVVSFETIEHLPDPVAFLRSLASCQGRIVISTPNRKTHSPGNSLSDKPRNEFHTVEWTPNEFAELIQAEFPDRQVRFLSQEGRWPGLIREGLDDEAMYCIAVIGDGELPSWPRLGFAMPTCDNAQQVQEAIVSMTQFYPGECVFAVVANGSSDETLGALRNVAAQLPHCVDLIEEAENTGYGRGANRGLAALEARGDIDLYGVTNDDILASFASMTELVLATKALIAEGVNPGLVGPVSNNIHGAQKVEIGEFQDMNTLMGLCEKYHQAHHSNVTQHYMLRGFFFLITPDCLETLGGFDPVYGLGNYEDDDYCLRAKLAGFTHWIVDGAVIFHHGSQTFKGLGYDEGRYKASIERNGQIFQWKWDVNDLNYWPTIEEKPEWVSLYIPFDAVSEEHFKVNCNGNWIDLVNQASDIEFAKWIYDRMRVRHRDLRKEMIAIVLADEASKKYANRQEAVA